MPIRAEVLQMRSFYSSYLTVVTSLGFCDFRRWFWKLIACREVSLNVASMWAIWPITYGFGSSPRVFSSVAGTTLLLTFICTAFNG